VEPSISLRRALDFPAPNGWRTFGDSTFFGQNAVFDESDPQNESSAQSSPLELFESTSLETEVTGPAIVSFSWSVSSVPNANFLTFFISDIEQRSTSGITGFNTLEFFVPAGAQSLRWTFSKTSNQQSLGVTDTAWVDQVELTAVTLPDLIVEQLTTEPGEYIVDNEGALDRGKLPVTLIAQNQGRALTGPNITASDVQIRLTSDRIWGNEDDIVLGTFAGATELGSADRLLFSGQLEIPLGAPEGEYFIASYVDYQYSETAPNGRVAEFETADYVRFSETDNNLFIADTRDISLRRLPDLVIEDLRMDYSRIHSPESPMEVDFVIRNRGLGDLAGNEAFVVRIDLLVIPRFSVLYQPFDLTDLLESGTNVKQLSRFSQNVFLPGASRVQPDGGGFNVATVLTLPTESEIREVIDNQRPMEEYAFYVTLTIDAEGGENGAVFESDENNTFWRERYDLDSVNPIVPNADPARRDTDGDGLTDFAEYALDRNPLVADEGGVNLLSDFGFFNENGQDYLAITFDINIFAEDVRYLVEVSADGLDYDVLLPIEPPYTDDQGPGSLTGNAGLLDSNTLVVGVSRRGITARVTVRDSIPEGLLNVRFMRLTLEQE